MEVDVIAQVPALGLVGDGELADVEAYVPSMWVTRDPNDRIGDLALCTLQSMLPFNSRLTDPAGHAKIFTETWLCLLYTSPSPRD